MNYKKLCEKFLAPDKVRNLESKGIIFKDTACMWIKYDDEDEWELQVCNLVGPEVKEIVLAPMLQELVEFLPENLVDAREEYELVIAPWKTFNHLKETKYNVAYSYPNYRGQIETYSNFDDYPLQAVYDMLLEVIEYNPTKIRNNEQQS